MVPELRGVRGAGGREQHAAAAGNEPGLRGGASDVDAQGGERAAHHAGCRRCRARRQAALAVRQGRRDQRPVGDALRAGDAHRAVQRAAGLDRQGGGRFGRLGQGGRASSSPVVFSAASTRRRRYAPEAFGRGRPAGGQPSSPSGSKGSRRSVDTSGASGRLRTYSMSRFDSRSRRSCSRLADRPRAGPRSRAAPSGPQQGHRRQKDGRKQPIASRAAARAGTRAEAENEGDRRGEGPRLGFRSRPRGSRSSNARGHRARSRSPGLEPAELLESIPDVDGLVIRSGTKVTADVIAAPPRSCAWWVAPASASTTSTSPPPPPAASSVMNTPEGNNVTTAEHAIALLVSLARHIPQATASMKAGKWEKKKLRGHGALQPHPRRDRARQHRPHRGRPRPGPRHEGDRLRPAIHRRRGRASSTSSSSRCDALLRALRRRSRSTSRRPRRRRACSDAQAFAKCRPGVLIVNAARGGIVDEAALLEALDIGPGRRRRARRLRRRSRRPQDHPLVAARPRDLHAAPRRLDRAGAGQRRRSPWPSRCATSCSQGVVRNAVNVPSVSPELMTRDRALPGARREARPLPGPALPRARSSRSRSSTRARSPSCDVAPITIAVLKGLLEPVSDRGEHGERAAHRPGARHQGDRDRRPAARSDFASAITTRVKGCVERLIAGAVFHGGQPRIVRIDDFMLEAIPEGPTLLHPQPRPARRGGHRRHDARRGAASTSRACSSPCCPSAGEAAMLVNVDSRPPCEGARSACATSPHMIAVQVVEL